MKSEHRHELKTNELAVWLINFPNWAREHLKMIIWVCVIAVLAITSVSIYWYRKNVELTQQQLKLTKLITQLPQRKIQILQTQARGVDVSYMLIQTADNLHAVAQNAKDDQMAAVALIKRAEALRTELHYRLGTVNKQDVITQIRLAKNSYNEAIEKSSSNPSLTAVAKLGLGLCEEELGNFDLAEQIYRDIAANVALEGTTAAVQAKRRLQTLADYQQKVVFSQTPKPAPTNLVQPQIELKAPEVPQIPNESLGGSDTNLPAQ